MLQSPQFSGLNEIAAGRDWIPTEDFGQVISRAPQTIRKNYCQTGECYGIRPTKVGNKLLWPVASIVALLQGEQK